MNAQLDRQLENVRTRIELLRLRWINLCDGRCWPPLEHEIDLLQREFNELAEMVRALVVAASA